MKKPRLELEAKSQNCGLALTRLFITRDYPAYTAVKPRSFFEEQIGLKVFFNIKHIASTSKII